MTPTTDRRSGDNSDFRRVYDQISALTTAVSTNHLTVVQELNKVSSAFQVHVTEDKVVADKVEEHEKKWENFQKLKDRGLIYAVIGFVAAGGLGGGAAHLAKKILE